MHRSGCVTRVFTDLVWGAGDEGRCLGTAGSWAIEAFGQARFSPGMDHGLMPNPTMRSAQPKLMLNKVPEVTIFFWVIKILCTTVGESFADYINETLGFGLTNTTLVFSAALVVALVAQFRSRRYVPGVYWLSVVLISVVGTLLTDNLTDARGVPLWISSVVFAVLLAAVF